MAFPLLKLIALRSPRLQEMKTFYEALGVRFVEEQHGRGLKHYSGSIGAAVLQLHPLPKGAPEPDKSVRLGFVVTDLGSIVSQLGSTGVRIGPSERNAPAVVIKDPDGRTLELTQE